jgi:putative membrane protein
MAVIVRWLLNALALYLTARLVPGISLRGIGATLLAAAVLGVVNALLRPLLLLLTLPLNVLTLGLFTFVVNAVLLLLTSALVPGFHLAGWGPALLGAVVLSLISFVLAHLVP